MYTMKDVFAGGNMSKLKRALIYKGEIYHKGITSFQEIGKLEINRDCGLYHLSVSSAIKCALDTYLLDLGRDISGDSMELLADRVVVLLGINIPVNRSRPLLNESDRGESDYISADGETFRMSIPVEDKITYDLHFYTITNYVPKFNADMGIWDCVDIEYMETLK